MEILAIAIAALVELGRRAYARDWLAVYTIVGSAVIGAGLGVVEIEGETITSVGEGVFAGLIASGLITVVSKAGAIRRGR